MDKTNDKRNVDSKTSLKDEVEKAVSNPGSGGHDARVWVRDDGAVCFGDECVTVKPGADGALDFIVKPDACGVAGEVILQHLIKTAGKGVRIIVPASEVKQESGLSISEIQRIAKEAADKVLEKK